MGKITLIRKRDGRIARFEREKIANAIYKAFRARGVDDRKTPERLSHKVVEILEGTFDRERIPGVEDVQDVVERVLMREGFEDVAKAYILYRDERRRIREAKTLIYGVRDDLKLSVNATRVLEQRYLLKNMYGQVAETPSEMFRRVANTIASADLLYNEDADVKSLEEEFYSMMVNLEFLPNSPTLMNAGTELGQLSACFVLPVEDSIDSIFNALRYAAIIHKSGGGTGFSFSRIRPKGDVVRSTGGTASGPISFMKVFDATTDVIKQGGRRRGANMGILRVDHPDIFDFISVKEREGVLSNFNISVAATDEFMEAVRKRGKYKLINPRNGEVTDEVPARMVFDLIVTAAWRNGEPGMIFLDTINRSNPTPKLGKIETTNPCGEQPLLPYESCNLGSINLAKMVDGGEIDWEKLRKTVWSGVHYLDNVIDVNVFPLPQIEEITKGNRKIGLGVMGFADMLIKLGIPYDSPKALETAERVMGFIQAEGRKASMKLAEDRGVFPNWDKSIYFEEGTRLRNSAITTIAPTGTLSIIAGCSSGIEPLFAVVYVRKVSMGEFHEVNPLFMEIAEREGFYSKELIANIAARGTVRGLEEVPEHIQKLFPTSREISPEWHVRMQAAFQKYVDNAVSKTVNLPFEATPEDVEKALLLAHELGCKGITLYRDKSRLEQVIYFGGSRRYGLEEEILEHSGGCSICI
ncbi:MAG: vitamin B12-dependent ribonucleotide reductase [Candidatus Geothermarchaeales archaeon]